MTVKTMNKQKVEMWARFHTETGEIMTLNMTRNDARNTYPQNEYDAEHVTKPRRVMVTVHCD